MQKLDIMWCVVDSRVTESEILGGVGVRIEFFLWLQLRKSNRIIFYIAINLGTLICGCWNGTISV